MACTRAKIACFCEPGDSAMSWRMAICRNPGRLPLSTVPSGTGAGAAVWAAGVTLVVLGTLCMISDVGVSVLACGNDSSDRTDWAALSRFVSDANPNAASIERGGSPRLGVRTIDAGKPEHMIERAVLQHEHEDVLHRHLNLPQQNLSLLYIPSPACGATCRVFYHESI
jgi:hypothetical protein